MKNKQRIATGLVGLMVGAVEAADLNVNVAPQMTNYGNAVHAELTVSQFYRKGIVEAGLETDLENGKLPNFKGQVIQFLPKDFSANALFRGSDEFLYVAFGPGHSFAEGTMNASLSAQVNVPVKEGKFEKLDFGVTAYLGYEPVKGLTAYAIGSASKGFKMIRAGVKVALPKLYKR